jgi:hypothetical protein
LQHSLALSLAALVLLTVMCLTTLMIVRTSGIVHPKQDVDRAKHLGQRGRNSHEYDNDPKGRHITRDQFQGAGENSSLMRFAQYPRV